MWEKGRAFDVLSEGAERRTEAACQEPLGQQMPPSGAPRDGQSSAALGRWQLQRLSDVDEARVRDRRIEGPDRRHGGPEPSGDPRERVAGLHDVEVASLAVRARGEARVG